MYGGRNLVLTYVIAMFSISVAHTVALIYRCYLVEYRNNCCVNEWSVYPARSLQKIAR
jgi:hypothetical protein